MTDEANSSGAFAEQVKKLAAIGEPPVRLILSDAIAKLQELGDLSCPLQSQKASP